MDIPIIVFLGGSILVFGQLFRWKFISDPPTKYGFYTHSIIKKYFGKKFLKYYNYIVGFLCQIFALIYVGIKYVHPMMLDK